MGGGARNLLLTSLYDSVMNTLRMVAASLLFSTVVAAAWGQSALVLTLDQALQIALDQGPDLLAAQTTLLTSRATDAQNRARVGLNVTSNLTYLVAKGINDPVQNLNVPPGPTGAVRTTSPSSSSVADDLTPQQVSGTATLSTPVTTLGVTATGTFQTNPDGKLLKSNSLGLNLSQTLLAGYFGGSAQAAADKSALTYQSAVLNAISGRNKALLAVKSAFYTLAAAQERASLYTQTLGQRQEAFKFIQAKALAGTATAYDIRVAQAAVRSAELDSVGGKNALTTAQLRLINLIGLAPNTDLKVSTPPPIAPAATLEEAVDQALKNRVELKTTALSAQASAIDAAVAAGASIPTVVLTSGVNFSQGDQVTQKLSTTPSTLVGTIGVRVTPPTIDSGLAENQAFQARTQQGAFQNQVDQWRRSIPVDVGDAWATWQLNGQRLDLAQTLVENADVNRQILKSQFDAGSKLIADWLNAEVAYSSAQLNIVNARLTWQQSAATLQNLMGL